MSVSSRFTTFLSNISLTEEQKAAGRSRRESVVRALNEKYYGSTSPTSNSKFVGSWGKLTRIRPPRDVDVLFEMPVSVYERFERRSGNKQSQLLQEIRDYLDTRYPRTTIRGDGPVVAIPFVSYNIELIPAFLLQSDQYWICMTDAGGYYKTADYDEEISQISVSSATYKNTRDIIRMMKCWQGYCSVPIKSFWIELVAIDFIAQWEHAGKSKEWYDWLVRDFLSYLYSRRNTYVYAPGTVEKMSLGDKWASRAETALGRANKACELENGNPAGAGDEWQKIFGTSIPKYT